MVLLGEGPSWQPRWFSVILVREKEEQDADLMFQEIKLHYHYSKVGKKQTMLLCENTHTHTPVPVLFFIDDTSTSGVLVCEGEGAPWTETIKVAKTRLFSIARMTACP